MDAMQERRETGEGYVQSFFMRRGHCGERNHGARPRRGWSPVRVLAALGLVLSWSALSTQAWAAAATATHPSASGPGNVLSDFQLQPGFRLELVAAEPMVVAPVALAFDENGRLFVAENPSYNQREGGGPRGRIRLLQGFDQHGAAQESLVYAEGLRRPSALACYAGGLFVAATPEVLYLKDSHGDGAADIRCVVLTGFGSNDVSSQTLLNNFKWGLNDRIYGVMAGLAGTITASNWPGNAVYLAGQNFSFDPRSLTVWPEAGPADSGLAFDESGRLYLTDHARLLRRAMYDPLYFFRNPFFAPAPELIDVAAPSPPVYLSHPGQTRAQQKAKGPPPVWMTNAQGTVIYRGNAFPTNYIGNAFIADPEAHVIHRVVLGQDGLRIFDQTPAGKYQGTFLVSKDPQFHPRQVVNGPDGALYIADWRDGQHQGRIYRITPAAFKRPKPPRLGLATPYQLVSALASPDGWYSDTAGRLLYERQEVAAVPLLSNMLTRSRLPIARVHALHALAGVGGLSEAVLLPALGDTDALVREHAVRLAEELITNGVVSDALWGQLKARAADPAVSVRYQLAFTVGQVRRPDKVQVLARVLGQDPSNAWIQTAVLSSVNEGSADLLMLLANTPNYRNSAAGLVFLRRLALLIGMRGQMAEVSRVVAFLSNVRLEPLPVTTLLVGLGEGLYRTGSSLLAVDPQGLLQPFYAQALTVSADPTVAPALQRESIRLLGLGPYGFGTAGELLFALCKPPPSPVIQSAAIQALCRFLDPGVYQLLVNNWGALAPGLRTQALWGLLSRTFRVGPVLYAIQSGQIPVTDLSSTQKDFLRTYPDPEISRRAVSLFGPVPVERPQVVEQFKDAVRLTGVPDQGRTLFSARCAACHSVGGGGGVGPDLADAKGRGKEQLLRAILEPNAQLRPDYPTCAVETKDGEWLLGVETLKTPATLMLRAPGAAPLVWPWLNVQSNQKESWSLMPTGLEQGLSVQDMANLLAYLTGESS